MSVTLINPFEVPSGKEEQFLREWTAAAELMRHEPGFLSSRLHQSLNPQAKFRFVNVAQWESAQHFQTAMSKETFQKAIGQMNYVAYPALYEIIAE